MLHKQKKKEEEKAREKELNDLFKVAVTQPKVPVGMYDLHIISSFFFVLGGGLLFIDK